MSKQAFIMSGTSQSIRRMAALALAFTASLVLLTVQADARAGAGKSLGSRGGQTFTTPPSTNTAPKPAAPVDKSFTQQGKSASAQSATAGQASRFGGMGMVKSLLLGGLIGAGLASLLGAGAFANILGFLLQAALIGGVVWLAIAFFRNRGLKPAVATAGAGPSHMAPQPAAYAGMMNGGTAAVSPALSIGKDDFDAFERLLGEVQTAYGRRDQTALATRTTPELLSYFAAELAEHETNGVRNELGQPKLLQGDLAQSWRESHSEYATVAMRYALTDATIESATGRVVSGSRTEPQEVTEVWTFQRPLAGKSRQWELSAIQQA